MNPKILMLVSFALWVAAIWIRLLYGVSITNWLLWIFTLVLAAGSMFALGYFTRSWLDIRMRIRLSDPSDSVGQ